MDKIKSFFKKAGAKIKLFFASKTRVLSCLFVFILVMPTLLWPILRNAVHVDVDEKRDPKAFEWSTNHLGASAEDYYNDRLPFRNNFIKLYNNLYDNVIMNLQGVIEKLTGYTLSVEKNETVFGNDGWTFDGAGAVDADYMRFYTGANVLPEEDMEKWTAKLVELDNYLKSKGKKMVLQITPFKPHIYSEHVPDVFKVVDEYARAERFVDYINSHSDIRATYPKKELLANKEKYENYYRRDPHYNEMGAWVTYTELQRLLGIPPTPLSKLEVIKKAIADEDFVKKYNINYDGSEFDYIIKYKPEIAVSEEVMDINGNNRYFITSDAPNNKTLMFVGDSFSALQLNYAAKDFSKVIKLTNFVNNTGINAPAMRQTYVDSIKESDIIVIECYETMDAILYHHVSDLMLEYAHEALD